MEDASVHASQTHISCTIPPKLYTGTALVAVRAVRLAMDSKTAPVNDSSIRLCFSAQRPSCWMTAATKGSSTIDYREVVKPLGGVLD